MKTIVPVAAALAILLAATIAPAQPQGVAPKDPQVQPPVADDLESLWRQIDCECDCECCEHIKALIKQRIKDPHRRPQLGERERSERTERDWKPRRQRDLERRERRIRHPRGTKGMWDRPWPRSGDRWFDAARHHRYLKARKANKARRHLDLTDDQREQMREIRYQWKMKRIDLEAKLDKAELEFKHLMRAGDMGEKEIRARVDAMASMRADLEFNRIMSRMESRNVLTEEQRKNFQWDRPREMKKKRRR
jgi:Spy/CpxP family protein refolding chaperone